MAAAADGAVAARDIRRPAAVEAARVTGRDMRFMRLVMRRIFGAVTKVAQLPASNFRRQCAATANTQVKGGFRL
ncbi:hypothetical protein GCM10010301_32860 [Streptomyces plicatus]|nr:hypothetical protein GCM10010301_32860 [Streptomyces plicatus]